MKSFMFCIRHLNCQKQDLAIILAQFEQATIILDQFALNQHFWLETSKSVSISDIEEHSLMLLIDTVSEIT